MRLHGGRVGTRGLLTRHGKGPNQVGPRYERDLLAEMFLAMTGRPAGPEELSALASYIADDHLTPRQVRGVLQARSDVVEDLLANAMEVHLFALHRARVQLMATAIPAAQHILDLGGANAPLCDAGYPYAFQDLTIVDLPPLDRHAEFANRIIEARETKRGSVRVLYSSMTDLSAIPDGSIDLAWSGQSVEHITVEDARTMYAEIIRVLAPSGVFCLDTPNGLLTRLHSPDAFVHPDHKVEYTPEQLRTELTSAGFQITKALGVCEMPFTVAAGSIDYRDFLVGAGLSRSVETCYVQFYECTVSGAGSDHTSSQH